MPASRSWWNSQRLERNAGARGEMARRRIAPPRYCSARWRWARLLPVRQPPAVAQIDGLLQRSVGDHLIFRWRGDQELAGGFIVGVVDGGQPLVRQVGPVDAEETSLAELVLEAL